MFFLTSDERMWPYSQTPPLEKCEQPDLKHLGAMRQNNMGPQNFPREEGGGGGGGGEGGRVSSLAHGL